MKEEKVISTDNFKIEKNIVSFSDSLLQISNISHITVEPIPKPEFRLWSIIVCIIGVVVMIGGDKEVRVLGFLIFLAPAAYIVWYVKYNSNSEEKYLSIYLNSGQVYYLYCENKKFLKRVMRVMKYCINNHTTQKIRIDFDECKLYNSPIIFGDGNEVD